MPVKTQRHRDTAAPSRPIRGRQNHLSSEEMRGQRDRSFWETFEGYNLPKSITAQLCSLRERERDRQTDRQAETDIQTETE